MKNLKEKSKFLSLILRHQPQKFHITIDECGWVLVRDLKPWFKKSELEKIVETDNKQRYSFDKYKTRIRANQGHSIDVDVNLKEYEIGWLDNFYHGTSRDFLPKIMKEGLKPMGRLFVHISKNISDASKVAQRRRNPIILKIDLEQEAYPKVFESKNGIILTKYVSPKSITVVEDWREKLEKYNKYNKA